jgi:hypothetical protein
MYISGFLKDEKLRYVGGIKGFGTAKKLVISTEICNIESTG